MKKFLLIGFILLFVVASMAECMDSCSEEEFKEKRENETEQEWKARVNLRYLDYISAIKENDYETAHQILDYYQKKYIKDSYSDWSISYWKAAHHIYKAEMMYLIPLGDQAANTRLLLTLANMTVLGEKPKEKKVSYVHSDHKIYEYFISNYNKLCDEMLELAILYGNNDMAQRVLKIYKEDLQISKLTDFDGYAYKLSFSSKEEALKKYKQAIKEGSLGILK